MTLETWWLYTGAVALLCVTPGPNMLTVMSASARHGYVRSMAAMAGCLTGLVTVLTVSALGVSALLLAMPGLFDALRYAGVAYLFWLGIKAWRGAGKGGGPGASPHSGTPAALYRAGLGSALSNPKAILFAAAFLPQFVSPHAARGPQFAILIATMAACDTLCYLAYAAGGRSLARALVRPAVSRMFDRFTGALFVGFGVALLAAHA